MSKEQTWHSIPGSRALKLEPLNNIFSSLTLNYKASSVYMILVCELPPSPNFSSEFQIIFDKVGVDWTETVQETYVWVIKIVLLIILNSL